MRDVCVSGSRLTVMKRSRTFQDGEREIARDLLCYVRIQDRLIDSGPFIRSFRRGSRESRIFNVDILQLDKE